MTLKTNKTGSSILSRIGVGAFLVAAMTVTAPITFAAGPDTPPTPPKVNTQSKQVMKWVENNNGVEATKHFEVITVDGVTTAYSIDENGNKTLVDVSEVEMMGGTEGAEAMDVFIMDGSSDGENHIKIMMDGNMSDMPGEHMMKMMDGDGQPKIMIKRILRGEDGSTTLEMDSDVFIMRGQGGKASAMVSAAQSLLDQADGKDLSNKARRKLDQARKALVEAQEALLETEE